MYALSYRQHFHHSVDQINRVRLPILLVVSWTEKMIVSLSPFAPENLVSRDKFGRPVPRQPAQLPHGIPPAFRDGVHI